MGEKAAAKYLRSQGYRVLGRNLRVPMGEADVLCIAPDRKTIVLVEVKSRRQSADGSLYAPPEASITQHKAAKLRAILQHLVRSNNWTDRPRRIDVVAVEFDTRGRATIRHHPGPS